MVHPEQTTRRSRRRDDQSGLTTLEWLLIVAAVAGLAALAVVLVQSVVDDTAEQIGGSSARKTASKVAAQSIMNDAKRDSASQPADAKLWGDWKTYYTEKCTRIQINYSDADVTVAANFTNGTKGAGTAPGDLASVTASVVDIGAYEGTKKLPSAVDMTNFLAECHIT